MNRSVSHSQREPSERWWWCFSSRGDYFYNLPGKWVRGGFDETNDTTKFGVYTMNNQCVSVRSASTDIRDFWQREAMRAQRKSNPVMATCRTYGGAPDFQTRLYDRPVICPPGINEPLRVFDKRSEWTLEGSAHSTYGQYPRPPVMRGGKPVMCSDNKNNSMESVFDRRSEWTSEGSTRSTCGERVRPSVLEMRDDHYNLHYLRRAAPDCGGAGRKFGKVPPQDVSDDALWPAVQRAYGDLLRIEDCVRVPHYKEPDCGWTYTGSGLVELKPWWEAAGFPFHFDFGWRNKYDGRFKDIPADEREKIIAWVLEMFKCPVSNLLKKYSDLEIKIRNYFPELLLQLLKRVSHNQRFMDSFESFVEEILLTEEGMFQERYGWTRIQLIGLVLSKNLNIASRVLERMKADLDSLSPLDRKNKLKILFDSLIEAPSSLRNEVYTVICQLLENEQFLALVGDGIDPLLEWMKALAMSPQFTLRSRLRSFNAVDIFYAMCNSLMRSHCTHAMPALIDLLLERISRYYPGEEWLLFLFLDLIHDKRVKVLYPDIIQQAIIRIKDMMNCDRAAALEQSDALAFQIAGRLLPHRMHIKKLTWEMDYLLLLINAKKSIPNIQRLLIHSSSTSWMPRGRVSSFPVLLVCFFWRKKMTVGWIEDNNRWRAVFYKDARSQSSGSTIPVELFLEELEEEDVTLENYWKVWALERLFDKACPAILRQRLNRIEDRFFQLAYNEAGRFEELNDQDPEYWQSIVIRNLATEWFGGDVELAGVVLKDCSEKALNLYQQFRLEAVEGDNLILEDYGKVLALGKLFGKACPAVLRQRLNRIENRLFQLAYGEAGRFAELNDQDPEYWQSIVIRNLATEWFGDDVKLAETVLKDYSWDALNFYQEFRVFSYQDIEREILCMRGQGLTSLLAKKISCWIHWISLFQGPSELVQSQSIIDFARRMSGWVATHVSSLLRRNEGSGDVEEGGIAAMQTTVDSSEITRNAEVFRVWQSRMIASLELLLANIRYAQSKNQN